MIFTIFLSTLCNECKLLSYTYSSLYVFWKMRGKNGIVNLHDFIDILENYQGVDSKFLFQNNK